MVIFLGSLRDVKLLVALTDFVTLRSITPLVPSRGDVRELVSRGDVRGGLRLPQALLAALTFTRGTPGEEP